MSEWGNPAERELRYPRKRKPTRGTETSQYPEEEKATAIPPVAASERGTGQTEPACRIGVVGPRYGSVDASRSDLERSARDGDSPVREAS